MIFLIPEKNFGTRTRANLQNKFLKFKNIAKFGCFFENFEFFDFSKKNTGKGRRGETGESPE